MDKRELLLEKTRVFRDLLVAGAPRDRCLESVLTNLTPMFDQIEAGGIEPPYEGEFRFPFQIEGPNGVAHPLFSAASEFQAALLDWRSKAWYQAALLSP